VLPDQEEVLIMAELHILELTCLEKEDPKPSPRNPDEASLKINGTRVSGPHSMIDGKVLPLNVLHGFTGTVAVTLIEEDDAPNPDDLLGTVVIPDTLAGLADEIGVFTRPCPAPTTT
jgi:hypothetical protein